MHFVILATDKANHLDLRMKNRADHLAYAKDQGCVRLAGPFLSEGDSPAPQGSLLIIEVKDRAAAEDFAAGDPYAKAGLFQDVRISSWTPALGDWCP